MNIFEKWYTFIILGAIIFGMILGQLEIVRENAELFIVPLLIVMLYITFLHIPLNKIRISFRNVRFSFTVIVMNFLWTPLLAWVLAILFLSENPSLWIGFIMLMVTPCTDWYLIFTGLAKGNVALSTAILPVNFLLQILLLPLYLLIFSGNVATIHGQVLIENIFLVLVVPLLLARVTNRYLTNKLQDKMIRHSDNLPILFLSLAIAAMFASKGSIILDHLDLLWKLTIPILLFFLINFVLGQGIGRLGQFTYPDQVSFSLTTLARNSPIALAVAMSAFPDQPLIALTLVVGPLLELPILAGFTKLLLMKRMNMD